MIPIGTNYYVNDEPTCNNPEHTAMLHIGKSSSGWKFGFHGVPEKGLTSWKAWQDFLQDRYLFDEYGNTRTLDEFRLVVENRRAPRGLDSPICRVNPTPEMINMGFGGSWNPRSDYHDHDGYDFYDGTFS